jgi:2-dehydro-3-deoxyphosphogluconate aldolase/(4S)-4-hydroxy-2-oxoglutarate aldolase
MMPDELAGFLRNARALAVLRTDREEAAGPAMEAAVRGGFRAIEFTLNTPSALDRIEEFACRPGLVVGAGTVLSPNEAREAVGRGARFLVSPVFDPEVLEEARRLGVCLIPGCSTPAELLRAHRAGATVQKLFPAPAGGPDWVRAVLGPLPFLRIVPTSGVDGENAAAYLRAGCLAVGFVGPLFADEDLETSAFDRIEERACALLASLS